jgi:hypothetical protein
VTAAGPRLRRVRRNLPRLPHEGSRSAAHDQTSTYAPSAGLRTYGLCDRCRSTSYRSPLPRRAHAPSALWRPSFPITAAGQSRIHTGFPFNPVWQNCLAGADSKCGITGIAHRCQLRCERAVRRGTGVKAGDVPTHSRSPQGQAADARLTAKCPRCSGISASCSGSTTSPCSSSPVSARMAPLDSPGKPARLGRLLAWADLLPYVRRQRGQLLLSDRALRALYPLRLTPPSNHHRDLPGVAPGASYDLPQAVVSPPEKPPSTVRVVQA